MTKIYEKSKKGKTDLDNKYMQHTQVVEKTA